MKIKILFATLLALALSTPGYTQTLDRAKLDQFFDRLAEKNKAMGSLVIAKDGNTIYARTIGYSQISETEKKPVTAATRFRIGSITKMFTAVMVLQLVDEKKLKWDDRVQQHLPAFELFDPYATRELTVRDLLCHRVGLERGDMVWYATAHDRAEVLQRIRHLKPTWSFRSHYGYQNIMFLAAGELAAAVTGGSWDHAVRERIFTPLGMRRSVTSTLPLKQMDDVSTPHERIDGKVTPVEWMNIDNIGPAGSINSSVSEMAQWVRLQLGGGTYSGRTLIDIVPDDEAVASTRMAGANLDHLCLRIEPFDAAAIARHLAAHGVTCGDEQSRYGAEGRGPSVYLNDPEGNGVELKGPVQG